MGDKKNSSASNTAGLGRFTGIYYSAGKKQSKVSIAFWD